MNDVLLWTGRLCALAGVLLCAWAVAGRLSGTYFLAGFQVGTVLQAGIVALLVGCVSFLLVLTRRPPR